MDKRAKNYKKYVYTCFVSFLVCVTTYQFCVINDPHDNPIIETEVHDVTVAVVQGDITRQNDLGYADVIVNPANQGLKRGGGVCGAIFAGAGLKLEFECNKLLAQYKDNQVPVGKSVITSGCLFDCRIIHVVPPNFNPNNFMQPSMLFDQVGKRMLERSYFSLLELAQKENVEIVALPFLSGGNFCRVPSDRNELAAIALDSVFCFCKSKLKHDTLKEVRFVVYSDQEFNLFAKEFENYIE